MLLATLGVLMMLIADLPTGPAPPPVPIPHFPDRLHACVWRNWSLVPLERLANTLGATPDQIRQMGRAMGLPAPPRISAEQQRRSYLTVIRRNWHLLPYDQLLALLNWSPERMAYTLREDDFLYIKLGSLKPRCEPIHYRTPDAAAQAREREIAAVLKQEFPAGLPAASDPLFRFVRRLSSPPEPESTRTHPVPGRFSPRFCYSYFALYGDPLLERQADPYPGGYLERMARAGVNGVWLPATLSKLAPFPWDPTASAHFQERLRNLRALTARAKRHGIGVYLYLNEPRSLPAAFFVAHPELKGVTEGDYATLCTSVPEVQRYLTDSIATVCRAVPDLAGFFTITASENLTHCWSHGGGAACPRCRHRAAAEVIAEVNGLVHAGIQRAGSHAQLIAWDWGWPESAVEGILDRLPTDVALMSVSEWDLPVKRGGVESVIGEYSVSAVGPGPRALRHWAEAKRRGLKTLAKIQAANSWELSTLPYLPVLENTAQHAANLREAQVDGLMLGWTLGGYPSPNLEVVAEIGQSTGVVDPAAALLAVAQRRFGAALAPQVVAAWHAYSAAFREFPFHIGLVYTAPMQQGPANLLWERPTGYQATMVGFPYDDLDTWRAVYPAEVYQAQFDRVADGFETATARLRTTEPGRASVREIQAFKEEADLGEAAAIHFRSVANQARFVLARRALATAKTADEAREPLNTLAQVLTSEIALARSLYALQGRDSRLGFEASNQYAYVPIDLLEKIVCCRDLQDRWLPAQRARFGTQAPAEPRAVPGS